MRRSFALSLSLQLVFPVIILSEPIEVPRLFEIRFCILYKVLFTYLGFDYFKRLIKKLRHILHNWLLNEADMNKSSSVLIY
jgi:hypothetical protein